MQKRNKAVTAWIGMASLTGAGVLAWQGVALTDNDAAQPNPKNALISATGEDLSALPPLPTEYVPLNVIQKDRARRAKMPKALRDMAFMQPFLSGQKLPPDMETLPGALPWPMPVGKAQTKAFAKIVPGTANSKHDKALLDRLLAQGPRLGRPLPPAAPKAGAPKPKAANPKAGKAGGAKPVGPAIPAPAIPAPATGLTPYVVKPARNPEPVIPRWVRYPLEFQLCGIGIGSRAVDKDRFNRIDRYGLFAMHGNPTAVVVPTAGGGVTIQQQPPEVASLFPSEQQGGLPDWAGAITVGLDNNHVEWLYNRDTYSMGFVVDRLGFVDAVVVAGIYAPIAKTQMEDPLHTVQLGDDFRKVVFRYGYPDTIETYTINAIAGVGAATGGGGAAAGGAEGGATGSPGTGTPGAGAGAPAAGAPAAGSGTGSPGAEGGAASAAGGAGVVGNAGFRTFELRYEQSYNVVFTLRDNRVVRIYIFGDPDFFNLQRRKALRTQY